MVYRVTHTVLLSLARAFFSFRLVGEEKIVEDEGVLIACNHESYLDPPLIIFAFKKPIHFLARKSLFRGPAAWLYPRLNAHPIDQDAPDRSGLKTIIRLLKGGERVLIFPEGARTETGELQEPAPGTGLIVAKSKVRVQPVRIFGARDCLPRGSSKVRRMPMTVVVGDIMEFSAERLNSKDRDTYQEISNEIMAQVSELKLPPNR